MGRAGTGKHTVRLEAPAARGVRDYDWANRVSVQFTAKELLLLLAVLMGWLQKFEAKGHGASNEKWIVIERQPGKMWIAVNAKGQQGRGAPAQPGEINLIVALVLRQMLRNDPLLSAQIVMQITADGRMTQAV